MMRTKIKPITCLAVPFAAGILVAAAISFPVISAPAPGSKVEIDNFAFSPGSIAVKTGTTVTWLNEPKENAAFGNLARFVFGGSSLAEADDAWTAAHAARFSRCALVWLPQSAQPRMNPGTVASNRSLIDVLEPAFRQPRTLRRWSFPLKLGKSDHNTCVVNVPSRSSERPGTEMCELPSGDRLRLLVGGLLHQTGNCTWADRRA
jgi:hypothetical protein